jgi:hypothetical protein
VAPLTFQTGVTQSSFYRFPNRTMLSGQRASSSAAHTPSTAYAYSGRRRPWGWRLSRCWPDRRWRGFGTRRRRSGARFRGCTFSWTRWADRRLGRRRSGWRWDVRHSSSFGVDVDLGIAVLTWDANVKRWLLGRIGGFAPSDYGAVG